MPTSERSKPYDQRLAHLLVVPLRNSFLHPNHFTVITLILGQAAAWLFALAISKLAWLAALLYMLAVFSDHLDGEYARLSGKTSRFGHHFDYIVGGINYTTLFIGIGWGLGNSVGLWAIILGFVAGLSNPLILYLRMHMETRFGLQAVEHPGIEGFEIEDFIYLIGPITWCAGILWFFIPFALGNIGYLVWTIRENNSWKHRTGKQ
jgi:archaetidylinositol phosphate synthase